MARKLRLKKTAAERREEAAQRKENRRAWLEIEREERAEADRQRRLRYAAKLAAGEVISIGHSANGLTFSIAR